MTLDDLRERERDAELRALDLAYDPAASDAEKEAATAAWVIALSERYEALRFAAASGYW